MPAVISMLRAVNVGGHNLVKMEDLRALYESLKLRDAKTYVQSGNVVFRTDSTDLAKLARKIEGAIEKEFGVKTTVIRHRAQSLRRTSGHQSEESAGRLHRRRARPGCARPALRHPMRTG